MKTVKVLTYNIHFGVDIRQKYDLGAICGVIKASKAEIVAIQEVDRNWSQRSDWQDQIDILSKCLDMKSVFAASMDLLPVESELPNRQFGNALFSKYPFLNSQVHHMYINDDSSIVYEGTNETEPRSILEAKIDSRGQQISVLCTHFSVHSQNERLRQLGKLEEIAGRISGPLIIMGDLNASPDAEELVDLSKTFTDPSLGKNLITKPDEARQIDYILVRNLEAGQVQVIESSASDHLPLMAQVTLG